MEQSTPPPVWTFCKAHSTCSSSRRSSGGRSTATRSARPFASILGGAAGGNRVAVSSPASFAETEVGEARGGWTDTNQRAKFYTLTPAGKKQLLRERDWWEQLIAAIGGVLNPDPAKG